MPPPTSTPASAGDLGPLVWVQVRCNCDKDRHWAGPARTNLPCWSHHQPSRCLEDSDLGMSKGSRGFPSSGKQWIFFFPPAWPAAVLLCPLSCQPRLDPAVIPIDLSSLFLFQMSRSFLIPSQFSAAPSGYMGDGGGPSVTGQILEGRRPGSPHSSSASAGAPEQVGSGRRCSSPRKSSAGAHLGGREAEGGAWDQSNG